MVTADVMARALAPRESPFESRHLRLSETGQCQRKRVYRALGYEPRESPELQGLFASGHVWEQWACRLLGALFPDALYEDPAAGKTQLCIEVPEYGAQGHCDFWSPSTGFLAECKNVRIGALHMGLPKDDHVSQTQAYLHFLTKAVNAEPIAQRTFPDFMPHAEILYIPREDPAQYRAYPVEYRPERGQEIEEELFFLRNCIDYETIPDRPAKADPRTFPCFYSTSDYDVHCPFHEYCWSFSIEKTLPQTPTANVTCESLVFDYQLLRNERSEMAARDKELKEAQARLEAAMSRYFPEGSKSAISVAGLQVSRTLVERTSYAVEKAISAGAVSREALEPFASVSSSWRHYVKGVK